MHENFLPTEPHAVCVGSLVSLWACSHSLPKFQRAAGAARMDVGWVQSRNVQSLSKYLSGTSLEPGALPQGDQSLGQRGGTGIHRDSPKCILKMRENRPHGDLRGLTERLLSRAVSPGPCGNGRAGLREVACHSDCQPQLVGAQLRGLNAHL